jgi:hypothetical protein
VPASLFAGDHIPCSDLADARRRVMKIAFAAEDPDSDTASQKLFADTIDDDDICG